MNDRVHRYLDGELTRADLSPEELREATAHEGVIREAADAYRTMPVPDLAARVMMRLPAAAPAAHGAETERARAKKASVHGARPAGAGIPEGPSRIPEALSRAIGWVWTPRPIAVRPAWALGAVALAAVLLLPRGEAPPSALESTPAAAASADGEAIVGRVFVQFRLDAPGASAVRLAGSFTGWEAEHQLYETRPGIWSILVPLEPGVHDYAFVVNGEEWVADPAAPAVADGFGGVNSRLSVLLPNGQSAS